MASGTDIASRLPAQHTVEREEKILQAVKDGEIVPFKWMPVPVSHRFHDGTVIRGTVYTAERALRLGTECDNFRPNNNHVTAQKIADALKDVPSAGAPEGVVCPTAKIMDCAARVATVKVDPCTQAPDAQMRNTKRMLEHSRCVDKSIGGRQGMTNCEGKGWANTNRLVDHPELEANYGLYADGGIHRSVLGMKLWQPGPGTAHISGYNSKKFPEGYTDYIQTGERYTLVMMDVEGRGACDIRDVARDPKYCWLISTEGPVIMRHPAVPKPGAEAPAPVVVPPRALLTRTLRYRRPAMTGQDVAFVQAVVRATSDGIFGPKTEAAVKGWQRHHKDRWGMPLDVDGIVGPKTRRAIFDALAVKPDLTPDVPDPFVPTEFDPRTAAYREARYYNRSVIRDLVHWIVLHSAEAAELMTTAEALMSYAATMADGRLASWHWAFDANSATRSVMEDRVAYHAKRANRFGVGYEHSGYARQSRSEWLDEYSESMLWISATTAAKITVPAWDLPPDNFVDAAGLKKAYEYIDAGKPVPDKYRGFTTHKQVTLGLGGSHKDPGEHFPKDIYLDMVKEAA